MKFQIKSQADVTIEEIDPVKAVSDKNILSAIFNLLSQYDDAEESYYKPFQMTWKRWTQKELVESAPKYLKFYLLKDTTTNTYVGFLSAKKSLYPNMIWGSEFVIDKSCRGKGFGRYMMKSVMESLKPNRMCLKVSAMNPAGIHLYESCGFKAASMFMVATK